MRKIGMVAGCLLALMLLPAGCGPYMAPAEAAGDIPAELQEELENLETSLGEALEGLSGDLSAKSHYWQVLDAEGGELYTLTGETAVAELDKLFQGDDWKVDMAPDGGETGGTAQYTYIFWQEKTLLAGQDPDGEREYEEVIRFMIPEEGNTVTMRVLQGLDGVQILDTIRLEDFLTFRAVLPDEAAEAFRDPWRFA